MTAKALTKRSFGDKTIWLLIVLLGVAGFVAHYRYIELAWSLHVAGFIVLAVVCMGLALLTQDGQRVKRFANDARLEVQKVVWPPRSQTVNTTLIVVAMVFVSSVVLWGIDGFFIKLIGLLAALPA